MNRKKQSKKTKDKESLLRRLDKIMATEKTYRLIEKSNGKIKYKPLKRRQK